MVLVTVSTRTAMFNTRIIHVRAACSFLTVFPGIVQCLRKAQQSWTEVDGGCVGCAQIVH
eukprot:209357-Pleurochrysis_carterae.AAC.1